MSIADIGDKLHVLFHFRMQQKNNPSGLMDKKEKSNREIICLSVTLL